METTDLKGFFNDKVKVAYAALAAVVVILVYLLLIKLDIGSLSKLKAFRTRAEQTLSVLKLLSDYKGYMTDFDKKFVTSKDANWLIGVLTDTAKKKSITLDLVKPVEEGEIFGYRVLSVLVEGKASYHQIGDFIAAIETSSNFFIINEFNIKAEENSYGSSGEDMLQMPAGMQGMPFGGQGMMMPAQMGQGANNMPGMKPAQNKAPFKEERITSFRLVLSSLSNEK